jgi:HEAT repeat protein
MALSQLLASGRARPAMKSEMRTVVQSVLVIVCVVVIETETPTSAQVGRTDPVQPETAKSGQGRQDGDASVSPQVFSKADTDDKRLILTTLATPTNSVPSDSTLSILQLGLRDSEAQIRAQALFAIAGRASGLHFSTTSTQDQKMALQRWQQDRVLLEEVRKAVEVRAINDTDGRVRQAAVMALGNLDFDPRRGASVQLSDSTVGVLASAYSREKDSQVRAEVVKTFALASNDSAAIRKVFVAGLSDSAPSVVHFAVRGIRRLPVPEALPRVGELLSSKDAGIRLGAVQALGSYGTSAKGYVEVLDKFSRSERDSLIKEESQRVRRIIVGST